jgi:hypothetical protein
MACYIVIEQPGFGDLIYPVNTVEEIAEAQQALIDHHATVAVIYATPSEDVNDSSIDSVAVGTLRA